MSDNMDKFKQALTDAGLPSLTVELEREVYDVLMAKAQRMYKLEAVLRALVNITDGDFRVKVLEYDKSHECYICQRINN